MGMSDVIGPRAIEGKSSIGSLNKSDAEIDRILKEQYDRGMKILTENRDVLDVIAKTLIEEEKITGV